MAPATHEGHPVMANGGRVSRCRYGALATATSGAAVAVIVFIFALGYVLIRIFAHRVAGYLVVVGGARWQGARNYSVVRDSTSLSVASTNSTYLSRRAVVRATERGDFGDASARHNTVSPSDTPRDVDSRLICIATAALHKAKLRGFAPGYERQDWLNAQAEYEAQGATTIS